MLDMRLRGQAGGRAARGLDLPSQRTHVLTHAQEGLSKALTAVNRRGRGGEEESLRLDASSVCECFFL